MNSHKAGVIAILFIALLGLLWAAATFVTKKEQPTSSADTITLTHTRNGDEQMYKGIAVLHAPCDQLASAISVSYTEPPTARIDLKSQPNSGDCTNSATSKEFVVSLLSPKEPKVVATFDGRPLPVVLVEGQ